MLATADCSVVQAAQTHASAFTMITFKVSVLQAPFPISASLTGHLKRSLLHTLKS